MKKYYIKERHNPQLGTYYVALGQLSKKEAKKAKDSIYGYNIIIEFDNLNDYYLAIEEYKESGFSVHY